MDQPTQELQLIWREFVIHEGAGRVKSVVRALGLWCVPSVVTVGALAEAFQSSIRPRWAGRSVSRCSRAQSSGRPPAAWLSALGPLTMPSSLELSLTGGLGGT